MKIAIFTGTILLTRYDARSIYVIETLKYLTKFKDLEIILIAPNDLPDELKNNAIKHISYTLYDKPHFRKLSSTISSIPKLLTLDCDLIHCYGHEAASIALLTQKIRRKNIPILFEMMGLDFAESEINARFSLKIKIFRPYTIWKESMLIKHSNGIITLTEAVKEYLLENYNLSEDRVFMVPHGVNLEVFAKEHKKDITLVNQLGLKNKKVILYTGAISPLSGVLDLIKAMEIINTKIKDVILIIVGYGPLELLAKDYVKKNRLDNVIFTGKVPHEEIPRYHSIADVLVNPDVRCLQTELDAPTKLFEYLASGKPIVASNLKSIAEIVKGNAILVEPENPQSFAEGILKLLKEEELGKRLGKNGKKLVLDFSWKETAKKTYEAYKLAIWK